MIKVLKSKKGMTLMELVVGMVLFTIIAATIASLIFPVLTLYAQANELAECNTLLDNVANLMISDLSAATSIPTSSGNNDVEFSIGSSYIKYTVPDAGADEGVLLKSTNVDDDQGAIVLTKDYYKRKHVEFLFSTEETGTGTACKLTVIILSDRRGEMIRRDYVVKPLVLNQKME